LHIYRRTIAMPPKIETWTNEKEATLIFEV